MDNCAVDICGLWSHRRRSSIQLAVRISIFAIVLPLCPIQRRIDYRKYYYLRFICYSWRSRLLINGQFISFLYLFLLLDENQLSRTTEHALADMIFTLCEMMQTENDDVFSIYNSLPYMAWFSFLKYASSHGAATVCKSKYILSSIMTLSSRGLWVWARAHDAMQCIAKPSRAANCTRTASNLLLHAFVIHRYVRCERK